MEKTLEVYKEEIETDFKKIQDRILVIEKEWNLLRIEQTRYQGEYRLINKLISQSERAGLPPFNPSAGETQPKESIEVKDGQ